jgi:type VI protein secretion system component VasK
MPLLDLFWTTLWFFLFFAWIWLLITIVADIFRSHDLNGWMKALWVLFVAVVPWLGVLVYLIARGGSMQERAMSDAAQREQASRDYIRQAASGGGSTADELTKLVQLRDSGVITAEQFEAQRAKILA